VTGIRRERSIGRLVAPPAGVGHLDRRVAGLARRQDRVRDPAAAARAGDGRLRFTWRQLQQEPLLVATRIAQVLARRTAA